jgi:ribosomal subunit interface protein
MIRFEIHGENLTITDAIRNYIEDKIGKLERYFNDVPRCYCTRQSENVY